MSNATSPFEWIIENLLVKGHKIMLEYDADSEDNLTRFFLRVNGNQGPGFAGENLTIIGELIIDSAIEGAFNRIDGELPVGQESASEEINCPGCQQEITPENAGGLILMLVHKDVIVNENRQTQADYRTFCMDCVKLFPKFPKDGRGYTMEVNYVDDDSGLKQTIFKWVGGGGVEPIEPWPRR